MSSTAVLAEDSFFFFLHSAETLFLGLIKNNRLWVIPSEKQNRLRDKRNENKVNQYQPNESRVSGLLNKLYRMCV